MMNIHVKMKAIILYLIFLPPDWKIECNTQNCKESTCSSDFSKSSTILKYVKEKEEEWSKLLNLIDKAVDSQEECSLQNCSCYYEVILNDLKPFESGISEKNIEDAAKLGTLYQIIDHRLYRSHNCMFPIRCKAVEHFLHKIIHKLPNIEFVINSKDWPMVPAHSNNHIPVFSFSKTKDYMDIAYPAWSFWEGGPAIKLYPSGIGRWDIHRKSLMKEAIEWPWERKINKGFFRGSRTSSERDNLVMLSRNEPNLVDAQYTKNQAWKSDADTLYAPPADEVSLESHCHYKYLFNYRGVAASFRLKHILLCRSLVFHVGNEWTEFFYFNLIPWVHYIPVAATASQNDIRHLLHFARENESTVKKIANRGYKFIKKHLKIEDVYCYWEKLLHSYSKLLLFKPKFRNNMQSVH